MPLINSLTPLASVAHVNNLLVLVMDGLIDLDGLQNLTQVDGFVFIVENENLQSLHGADNISTIPIELRVADNPTLLTLFNSSALLQAGAIVIDGNELLLDMLGLEGVMTVDGNLLIRNNDLLSDLTGLGALESCGNMNIRLNGGLNNFSGAVNLTTINGPLSVNFNASLSSLEGLDQLTTVSGPVGINFNANLTSLEGLDQLTTVNGNLTINSALLSDASALVNLSTVQGELSITNTNLTSLEGFRNIDPAGLTSLLLEDNGFLTRCAYLNVCSYLSSGGANLISANNGSQNPAGMQAGCQSAVEITSICSSCTSFDPQITLGAFDEMFGSCLAELSFIMSDLSGTASLVITTNAGAFGFQSTPGDLTAAFNFDNSEVTFTPADGNTTISFGGYNDGFGTFFIELLDPAAPSPVITITALNEMGEELCFFTYTYECSQEGNESCADDFTLTETGGDQCCPSLSYANTGSEAVFGVSFILTGGVVFDPVVTAFPEGYVPVDYSSSTRVLALSSEEALPASVEDLLDFCMLNVNDSEQQLIVDYLGANLRTVLCSDTLTFNCPIQNYCLDVASDTLVCAEDGYRLQMNVVVPDNNYTDDVGRVKVVVPGIMDPIMYDFPMPLTAGESFGIDTLLNLPDLVAGDTLKVLVTAHDGPEERLCCFADSLCLEVPDCASCDGATITFDPSEDECCWSYFITFPNSPPDIDSVWFLFQEFTGADFLLTELDNPGWQRITITPGEEYAYIPIGTPDLTTPLQLLEICTTPGGDNVNALISYATFNRATRERLCNFTGGGLQEACPAKPCDSLAATLQSAPDTPCAYDLFLDNTYTTDPDLITSVTVNIISGPEPNFSGANLIPTAPGWDFATGSGGSYTLNPADGAMPLGTGQQVFRFNIKESFSADSTYVEVAFLSGMDTLCRDTVVGICPGCITIPEEEILCDEDHHLYRFTFINHSPYPVNAVRILETDTPGMDVLLNAQTHFLGVMVPVGGTYTGFLPVEFMDNGDGELCFDIVLRQVVDGELPINCCFATYCVEVSDCSGTQPERCVERAGVPTPDNCPLEYLPVCGCDGITYTNICFAQDRGVVNYTQGPCPTTPRPFPNFPIDGIEILDGTVIISTPIPFPIPDGQPNWHGYILQRLRTSDDTWWQVAATTVAEDDIIRLVDSDPAAGDQTYRLLAVTIFGEPFLSETASIDVPARRAGITLSPNPATGAVWITSEYEGAATIEIISVKGQRSSSVIANFAGTPVRLDLGQRAAGVHTVVVRFDDGRWGSKRVVVE
ncbi:hypothetical protein [Neolewinella persica]|uniref:hypothetical protein n=1 Tax=Neolewinella persica TaxID=70998 RepID=UPI001B7FC71F|nr:hypothetical protein [Neolewinella persica]